MPVLVMVGKRLGLHELGTTQRGEDVRRRSHTGERVRRISRCGRQLDVLLGEAP